LALGSRSVPGFAFRAVKQGRQEMLRKMIVALVAVGALVLGAGPAFGAEHHPPKFGPHDTQCEGKNNQPNCPGSH
jgi:hypothetical protein